RALAGLLDNAARHSSPGARVRLSAERHGDELILCVRDEGPGLSADAAAALPELSAREARFWHGAGGLGLGLAFARDVARLHGGQLTVTDVPGPGGEFV